MQTTAPTKTQSTLTFYAKVVQTLERHGQRLVRSGKMVEGLPLSIRLAVVVDYLETRVTAATARLYRAAATQAIKASGEPEAYKALDLLHPELDEAECMRQDSLPIRRAATMGNVLRGAAQKARWISQADWTRLFESLRQTESKWSRSAQLWIAATLLAGLRPCEWRHASWDGTKLCVANAKATNGRAPAPTRTIDLGSALPAERDAVSQFTEIVSAAGPDGFDDLYAGVRNLIRIVARRTFTERQRYPTLYTARHVFASRAKATYPRDMVAALLGHASLDTAGRHYAQSHHARGGRELSAQPDQADVEAVRRAQAAKQALSEMPK